MLKFLGIQYSKFLEKIYRYGAQMSTKTAHEMSPEILEVEQVNIKRH